MAVVAGQATLRTTTTTLGTSNIPHSFRASTGTADPGNALGAGTAQAFELAAGASITIHSAARINSVVGTPTAGDLKMWVEIQQDNHVDAYATGSVQSTLVLTQAAPLVAGTLYAGSDVSFTAANSGTYRIRVRAEYAQVTSDAVNGGYKADSDGNYSVTSTPNTWSASAAEVDQGYVRAGCALSSFAYSDASLGGAAPANNVFAYGKQQFFQATLGTAPIANSSTTASTLTQRQAGAAVTTDTTALAGSIEQLTRAAVSNAFPAAATATAVRIVPANSTLSGVPWVHFTSAPAGWTLTIDTQADSPAALYTIDPRITFTQLLQLNSSAWATPPSANNVANGQRLTSDLGVLAARATDANGVGINALAWTEKLWDAGNLISSSASPAKTRATTSQTQGGQAGWSDAFVIWDNALPGGAWTQTETITTANATGLEVGNSRTLTLLAINPNIKLAINVTPISAAAEADHLHSGDSVNVVLTMIRLDTDRQQAADASPSPTCVLTRYNETTQHVEYLTSDGATWANVAGATLYEFAFSADTQDANTYLKTFSGAQTASWGNFDLLGVYGKAYVNGTPYVDKAVREIVGRANSHAAQAFDGVQFGMSGVLGFM